jgi:uncharacterized protein YjbJ (UPF0337 family)
MKPDALPVASNPVSGSGQDRLRDNRHFQQACHLHARTTEMQMNEDRIKGQWKQLQGKLKARWGKLTDDDLQIADGNTEYLVGKLQERYGIAKDKAREQVTAFDKDL